MATDEEKRQALASKIQCAECAQWFSRITNTHLWKYHRLTIEEYKQKHPGQPIDSPLLIRTRLAAVAGKSYEDIYGVETAAELRALRSASATEQMQNPHQITTRQQNTRYSYRTVALEHYGLECQRCGTSSENEDDFHVHHLDHINVNSELGDHSLDNLTVLCVKCHKKYHSEMRRSSQRILGFKTIELGVHTIFQGLKQGLGLDLTDENFKDTPKRIARAYAEIFEGVATSQQEVEDILQASFPNEGGELVMAYGIRAYSMCPHHLLPVEYSVEIGYIPGESVLGLSKLARIVEILARRPVLQEQFVGDVANALMKIPGCKGAGCIASGRHYCMIMRGVNEPDVVTVTSALRGVLLDDPSAKAEFLSLARERHSD